MFLFLIYEINNAHHRKFGKCGNNNEKIIIHQKCCPIFKIFF